MGRCYLPEKTISKAINGTNRHRLERNPKTYLDIRQDLKEKHGVEIRPFPRTVTLLDLPKIEKELNASIHIHHLRESYQDEDTGSDHPGKVTSHNPKPLRVGGKKEAPEKHEIHLCFVGEKITWF